MISFRNYTLLLLSVVCGIFLAAPHASAQSWDEEFLSMRNNAVPSFHHSYDDILQYSPAAVVIGLKACGYKGREGWGPMLTADAFSAAIMTGVVNGLKYSVRRLRPDGSRRNSFPSGHTATAFLTATMLHKEYGWRSPWFSIGGYTIAAVTGVSRVLNNRHWMSDVVAGAAIGIGSVHLGYWLSDLIFRGRYMNPAYETPVFSYDPSEKHYTAEMLFGYRFIIGAEGRKEMGAIPYRGGQAGIQTDIPVVPGIGVTARASASSMAYKSGLQANMYNVTAGGFYNFHFLHRLEFSARATVGYAWHMEEGGIDLTAGAGLGVMLDSNFRIKMFADFESISLSPRKPWLNSVVAGFSTAWVL